MKTQKIVAPEGYEIDREKSTIDEIVFKEIKKQLPKSWEELVKVGGWVVDSYSGINVADYWKTKEWSKGTFYYKEQAAASIALAQLSQLREVYRDGWIPNWEDGFQDKFAIHLCCNNLTIEWVTRANHFLSFQSREIAEDFLLHFYDLIEQAKPLMN